ncbi:MAG: 50S ribosomal protein L11 methyltransferase [Chitinophagaceae bacterium]|nr:50S ribosomal protein L11 methyltransferase [Chitinophagaceae bacterium]
MQLKIYKEVGFIGMNEEMSDILIAELLDNGYYGFLEEAGFLKAYIESDKFDQSIIDELGIKYGLQVAFLEIPETNWNADWETSFEPVIVNDFVAIRASFHEPVKSVQYEIVITPKMSFGTGHHATTYLVLDAMQQFDWKNKKVLDFGTGTGVLAIFAEKLGASEILAIDNNQWSIENSIENVATNNCNNIQIIETEVLPEKGQYDIILANINKHVLIENCEAICEALLPNSILILSGLLAIDETDIVNLYGQYLGKPYLINSKNNWIVIVYSKNC